MLFLVVLSIVAYMGSLDYRPSISERIKHISDGYKLMNVSARKAWVDFFNKEE